MKKIQLLAIGTGLFTLSALNNANAENAGTINFTGTIVATLCTLSGTPLNVPLGIHPLTDLANVGDQTELRSFDLNLTGCPVPSNATLTFQGAPSTPVTLLALTAASTATNVAIALYNQAGDARIDLNTPMAPIALTTAATTLTFSARYQAITGGAVTAGTANGTATLDIVYN
ncbi:MAG: fimbrial protein [Yersinia sp. (in: enterobacteria)]